MPLPLPFVITEASTAIRCSEKSPDGEKPPWAGFYGFKLHWVIKDRGELLAAKICIIGSCPPFDKRLLPRRSLIETIHDQFKNISQIEHTRRRSIANFMVNLVAGMIAYTH
ncbi:transposase [Nitrosococcus oceani]|uniref:transposase n=1 Tax=Nitrosococcus oceani TaxID=1229 RepID=UPI0008F8888E